MTMSPVSGMIVISRSTLPESRHAYGSYASGDQGNTLKLKTGACMDDPCRLRSISCIAERCLRTYIAAYATVDIVGSISEFLVKHFVRGGRAEVAKAIYITLCAYYTAKRGG